MEVFMEYDDLTGKIIKAAYKVHNVLGKGFLEKVYQNAMFIELTDMGLSVEMEMPLEVYYKNHKVGFFYADLIVEDEIIIELKAVENLVKIHEVQLVNYLNATEIDVGLLINFGDKVDVKRKFRNYKKEEDI